MRDSEAVSAAESMTQMPAPCMEKFCHDRFSGSLRNSAPPVEIMFGSEAALLRSTGSVSSSVSECAFRRQ